MQWHCIAHTQIHTYFHGSEQNKGAFAIWRNETFLCSLIRALLISSFICRRGLWPAQSIPCSQLLLRYVNVWLSFVNTQQAKNSIHFHLIWFRHSVFKTVLGLAIKRNFKEMRSSSEWTVNTYIWFGYAKSNQMHSDMYWWNEMNLIWDS